MTTDVALVAALLLLPLAAAFGAPAFARHPRMRDGLAVVMSVLTAGCAVWAYATPPEASFVAATPMPGLTIMFAPEPLGLLFALTTGVLWPLATSYAIGYLRVTRAENRTRFMFFYAASIHAAMGVAMAGNLLTLFVFYELLTFVTYPLVVHAGGPLAKRTGRIYLGMLIGSSMALLLPGMIALWTLTGAFAFDPQKLLAANGVGAIPLPYLLALFAFGIGKAALIPMHVWLPSAMTAPAPVSALLHAVAVVKAGAFAMLKVVVYVFGIDLLGETGASEWLAGVAATSILVASCVALTRSNIKERLAYSTVGQLGYITLGAAMASSASIGGASLHLLGHAVGKVTLFFCAGAMYAVHGIHDVKDTNGLARMMPLTFVTFTVGFFSLVGGPASIGASSKALLAAAARDGRFAFAAAALTLSSLLTVVYLGEIVVRGFFRPSARRSAGMIAECPATCLIPMCMAAALCFLAPLGTEYLLARLGDLPGMRGVG